MGKIVRDEDLRLNIIVNGDPARRKISDLTREVRDLSNENRVLRQEQSRLKGSGQQNTEQYKSLTKQIAENSAVIKRNKAELNSMRDSMALSCMTMDDLSRKATSLRIALRHTVPGTVAWHELANQLKEVTKRHEELKLQSKETGLTLGNLASKVNRYIGLITAGFATLTIFKQMINNVRQAYMEYDEALTSASRTTNMTKEEMRELSDELKKLDTRTSQNNLLALAEVAGKLGISGQNDILGFVSAADKINVALSKDLGGNAEEALRQIGKLVDIFKLKDDYGMERSMLKVGSAINTLGMTSTANEGYIVEFAQGMAGIAPTANMSIEQILGLAATLDSLGQRGETATTALGQTIMGMFRRTEQFANVAQMSLEDFTALLNTDVNEALLRVLEGAGQGGTFETVAALSELGLEGQRASQILGSLSQNTDTIRQQQALAAEAFREGTSVIEEFDRMNSSAMATMEKKKKKITEEAVALGEQLTPIITHSLSLTTYGIRLMSSIISFATKYKAVIIGLATVIVLYNGAKKVMIAREKLTEFYSKRNMVLLRQRARELALLKSAEMAVSKSTALLCAVQNLLVGNLTAANIAFKTLLTSIGPLGWAFMALGAVVGAVTTAMAVMNNRNQEAADISKKAAKITDEEGQSLVGKAEKMRSLMRIIEDTTVSENSRNAAIKELQELMPNGVDLINQETIANGKAAEAVKKHTQALIAQATIKAALEKEQEILDKAGEDKLSGEDRKVGFWQKVGIGMAVAGSDGMLNYNTLLAATEAKNAEKYEKKTEASLKRVRAVAEKAQKELQSLAETDTETGATSTITNPNTTQNGGGFGNDTKWSLSSDEQFLQARLALKKKYQTAETMTEEEFNAKLLQLEIDTLKKRLATNADSGEDRIALEEQLADKFIQQKERQKKQEEKDVKEAERKAKEAAKAKEDEARKQDKINQDIAEMSGDRIAIEKAKYEKLKREYAGNARALEALEKAHKTRLAKIQLDEADKEIDARRDAYEIARVQMLNRHRQEMETFSGSERERREKRKEHWAELNALDEKYLNEMISTLTNLVDKAQVGNIKIGAELSDADKAKLLKQIEDLRQQLDKLKNTSASTEESEKFGGNFLGLSGDRWQDMLDGNIEGWREWADAVADIVSGLGNQVLELWGSVDKYMSAAEDSQLKEYEKNNDKKKSALEKRLNAGLITEAQYNAEVAAMEAEHEAYKEELELKQAKRQKAMSITESVINTAVGVTKSLTGLPWPINLVAAAATLAMGVAQTALIAATPITTGAEDGGPIGNGLIDVRREQDGKLFRARLNPNKRGFVSSPTVLVAENGAEYVLPHEAVENPTIAPFIEAMESARQHGTLSDLDMRAVYPSVIGRANGGYAGYDSSAVQQLPHYGNANNDAVLYRLAETVDALTERLKYPIDANVSLLGPKGFYEQDRKYHKSKTKRYIGQ